MSESQQMEFAVAVKHMKENAPAMLELIEYQAKMWKKRYSELRKNGFTEDQALKLCTQTGY